MNTQNEYTLYAIGSRPGFYMLLLFLSQAIYPFSEMWLVTILTWIAVIYIASRDRIRKEIMRQKKWMLYTEIATFLFSAILSAVTWSYYLRSDVIEMDLLSRLLVIFGFAVMSLIYNFNYRGEILEKAGWRFQSNHWLNAGK